MTSPTGGSVNIKVGVVGAPAVGKTSLINCFMGRPNSLDYRPTDRVSSQDSFFMACLCRRDSREEVRRVRMTIYDIPGANIEDNVDIISQDGISVVIAVYDVTRRKTFASAFRGLRCIRHVARSPLLYFLVANKRDAFGCEVRQVEGWRLCVELGIPVTNFLDTSCLDDGDWIRSVFFCQVRQKAYLHHCKLAGCKVKDTYAEIDEIPAKACDCCDTCCECECSACADCFLCCVS